MLSDDVITAIWLTDLTDIRKIDFTHSCLQLFVRAHIGRKHNEIWFKDGSDVKVFSPGNDNKNDENKLKKIYYVLCAVTGRIPDLVSFSYILTLSLSLSHFCLHLHLKGEMHQRTRLQGRKLGRPGTLIGVVVRLTHIY